MEASRLHLWEIADEIQALEARVVEAEGELTPELESEWDRLAGSLESKVENTALYIRELEANAKAAREEEDRVQAIRKALENRAARLKDYLHHQMVRLGKDKVETPRARVRVQANSRPSIRWTKSDDAIPAAFKRVVTTVSVDNALALEEWKAGGELPDGFVVETGTHVRIS